MQPGNVVHEWKADGKKYQAVVDEDYAPDCCHGENPCDRQEPDDEHPCQYWLDEENEKLDSYEWIAIGIITSEQLPADPHCGTCSCAPRLEWKETDSLWGIVVDNDPNEIEKFAMENM